jgi:hypothetical protein
MSEINPRREAQTRLRKLEAQATHTRQRYDLYKAKTYGPRPTEPGRLLELERLTKTADSRLERARSGSEA